MYQVIYSDYRYSIMISTVFKTTHLAKYKTKDLSQINTCINRVHLLKQDPIKNKLNP